MASDKDIHGMTPCWYPRVMEERYAWLWDVDLIPSEFDAILAGRAGVDPEDRRWALLRLLEYAPYRELRRLIPLEYFLVEWPNLAPSVRSRTRRQGMEFFYHWHKRRAQLDA